MDKFNAPMMSIIIKQKVSKWLRQWQPSRIGTKMKDAEKGTAKWCLPSLDCYASRRISSI
jgi:hypothetical protein